jgi:hypothetical protein
MKPWVGALLAVGFQCFLSHDAMAHVKWFAPYDLTKPPLRVDQVFTADFIDMFLLSLVCIFTFFWIDRYLYHKDFLAETLKKLMVPEDIAFWVMRVAAAIAFVSLFAFDETGRSFYLTPELRTHLGIVPWLHLAIGLAVLYRPTVPLTGLGIVVLYGMGIAGYGVYHMLDYLIFLGIGAYFALASIDRPKWVKGRYIGLYAATGLTLLWAAIEKWGFPGWTFPLLSRDASLLMGLTPQFYMMLAGFVEFNIAFILLTSASVCARFIALGLNAVFILAIYKFGLIDAIGHLMIIAVLLVMTIRGPTSARYIPVLSRKSPWTEAYLMTGAYVLTLNLTFISYYGLYFLLPHH